MLKFLRRRIVSSALPLVVVVLGTFLLARMTGNPANLYLPIGATQEAREEYARIHGFDRPVWEQFQDYVVGLLQGDAGESLRTGEGAWDMVFRAFGATLPLAGITLLLTVIGAVVIGCWAAYRPNSIADRISSLLSLVAASVPDFWLALMGILVFAVTLGWLPTSGTDGAAAWILPVAVLMLRPIGVLSQVVRGSMVSALSAPYIKVARSKGAGETRVVVGHALRNASAPALTVAGDLAVGLLNGAIIVETVFGWPGVGKLMIDSVLQRDFAVLQAGVLLVALAIFALNILIDIGYAALDPRVRQLSKA